MELEQVNQQIQRIISLTLAGTFVWKDTDNGGHYVKTANGVNLEISRESGRDLWLKTDGLIYYLDNTKSMDNPIMQLYKAIERAETSVTEQLLFDISKKLNEL